MRWRICYKSELCCRAKNVFVMCTIPRLELKTQIFRDTHFRDMMSAVILRANIQIKFIRSKAPLSSILSDGMHLRPDNKSRTRACARVVQFIRIFSSWQTGALPPLLLLLRPKACRVHTHARTRNERSQFVAAAAANHDAMTTMMTATAMTMTTTTTALRQPRSPQQQQQHESNNSSSSSSAIEARAQNAIASERTRAPAAFAAPFILPLYCFRIKRPLLCKQQDPFHLCRR